MHPLGLSGLFVYPSIAREPLNGFVWNLVFVGLTFFFFCEMVDIGREKRTVCCVLTCLIVYWSGQYFERKLCSLNP